MFTPLQILVEVFDDLFQSAEPIPDLLAGFRGPVREHMLRERVTRCVPHCLDPRRRRRHRSLQISGRTGDDIWLRPPIQFNAQGLENSTRSLESSVGFILAAIRIRFGARYCLPYPTALVSDVGEIIELGTVSSQLL